jgi:hypothetical protein
MSKQRKNAVDNSKATEVSPEVWAPAQTLYNASELFLTPADIGDAAQLLSITDEQIHVEFAECLQSIARQYWRQHLDARRPPAAWYREHVAQIQMNIEAALALLRSAKGTALSQLKFVLTSAWDVPSEGSRKQTLVLSSASWTTLWLRVTRVRSQPHEERQRKMILKRLRLRCAKSGYNSLENISH